MRQTIFKNLVLLIILISTNCQTELQYKSNSVTEIKGVFNKEEVSKNIPYDFEVNWNEYSNGFLDDLKSDYFEFELIEINKNYIQSNSSPNKLRSTYKLLVTTFGNNSYNFYTVKYLQKNFNETFTLDISNPIGFSGKIYLSDNSNNLIVSKKYENGQFKGYINQLSQAEYEKGIESARMDLGCYNEATYHYIDWYQYNGSGWSYLDSELTGVTFEQICDGGGSGDAGSGPTGGGGDGTYFGTGGGAYEDCGDPVHGCLYEIRDLPCIINQLITPCLNNTANNVLDQNLTSTFNQLIQSIFNSNDKVNLILKEGALSNSLGKTSYVDLDNGFIDVSITLDPSKFLGTSQEFLGAVIYHECFHAIVDYLSNGNVSEDDQHIALYVNYLNLLADALQTAYPSMQPGDAKGLILNGLLNLDGGTNPPPGYWKTSLVDKILASSGFTRSQINIIYNRYQVTHTSGTPCN